MKTIHSFFIQDSLLHNNTISLTSEHQDTLNQWIKVLRFRVGDTINILDNSGEKYYCILRSLDRKQALLDIQQQESMATPAPRTLWLPLIPLKKIELIIKMSTEIGITHFRFFSSDHGQDTMHAVLSSPTKQYRLHEIAKEAAEQSEKFFLPTIDFTVTPFDHAVEQQDLAIMFERGEDQRPSTSPTSILIGPEGGFSDAERELILTSNLPTISYPHTILRVETAAVMAAGELCIIRSIS